MSHKVFVYGTLKRNEPNHQWLMDPINGRANFVGRGTTKSKYPLIIATRRNYPFILYSPENGDNVEGEVYEIDDVMLDNLDTLEDHPKYYVREIDDILVKNIETTTMDTHKCWVYFLKTFKPELLRLPTMANYTSEGSHGRPYMYSKEATIDDLDEEYQLVKNGHLSKLNKVMLV